MQCITIASHGLKYVSSFPEIALAAAIGKNLSLNQIKERIKELNTRGSKRQTKQEKKFTQKLSQVTKRLQDIEIWKDVERRKKAEKLLDELNKLTTP